MYLIQITGKLVTEKPTNHLFKKIQVGDVLEYSNEKIHTNQGLLYISEYDQFLNYPCFIMDDGIKVTLNKFFPINDTVNFSDYFFKYVGEIKDYSMLLDFKNDKKLFKSEPIIITKEQIAIQLNGRDSDQVIYREEEEEAKQNSLIVIFIGNDYKIKIRGAINKDIQINREDEEMISLSLYKNKQGDVFVDLSEHIESFKNSAEERGLLIQINDVIVHILCQFWVYAFLSKVPMANFLVTCSSDEAFSGGVVIDCNDLPIN